MEEMTKYESNHDKRPGVITIRAPKELIKKFRIKLIENNTSMQEVLLEYIKKYVEETPQK